MVKMAPAGLSERLVKELKTAFSAGLISDERRWLDALSARNNVSHSYDEGVALEIVLQTKETYFQMFKELAGRLVPE